MLIISIVKYKSTDDILQGINKLDSLLKISIFQKYIEGIIEKEDVVMLTTASEGKESANFNKLVENVGVNMNFQNSVYSG